MRKKNTRGMLCESRARCPSNTVCNSCSSAFFQEGSALWPWQYLCKRRNEYKSEQNRERERERKKEGRGSPGKTRCRMIHIHEVAQVQSAATRRGPWGEKSTAPPSQQLCHGSCWHHTERNERHSARRTDRRAALCGPHRNVPVGWRRAGTSPAVLGEKPPAQHAQPRQPSHTSLPRREQPVGCAKVGAPAHRVDGSEPVLVAGSRQHAPEVDHPL